MRANYNVIRDHISARSRTFQDFNNRPASRVLLLSNPPRDDKRFGDARHKAISWFHAP